MAKNYEIEVYSQPNLYRPESRTMTVYFSEPDSGIRRDTGILLLIAGYGGEANSNVFQKMRRQFADKYNLVTVQCNYFGWQFMQTPHDVKITADILEKYLEPEEIVRLFEDYEGNKELLAGKTITYETDLGETMECFNEMGHVQAMDQLVAIKVVTDILEQNGYCYDKTRVIAYGQSHGAYLAYLCNVLMPDVLTGIIDNSSYLFPEYMYNKRGIMLRQDNYYVRKDCRFLVGSLVCDNEIYDLRKLYENFNNHAEIICFHGTTDSMIPLAEKQQFLSEIQNVHLEVIGPDRVDGKIFKNTSHILGADYLELFAYAVERYGLGGSVKGGSFAPHLVETDSYKYQVDVMEGIPVLCRMLKTE